MTAPLKSNESLRQMVAERLFQDWGYWPEAMRRIAVALILKDLGV